MLLGIQVISRVPHMTDRYDTELHETQDILEQILKEDRQDTLRHLNDETLIFREPNHKLLLSM